MHDPGNAHGVIYMWGTNGIGYNEKMVKALMPDAPLDSWRLVFDPAVAAKVAKCGISVLDSPAEMMRAVYSYLGKDPNSQSAGGSGAGRGGAAPRSGPTSATSIPPSTSRRWPTAISASPSATTATSCRRAIAPAKPTRASTSSMSVPKEGSILWFDMLAIPKDAPNPDSAYAFMNYMMTPQVIADVSNFKRYANANAASQPLVLHAVKNDPGIYPPPEQRAKAGGAAGRLARPDPRDHARLAKIQDGPIGDDDIRRSGRQSGSPGTIRPHVPTCRSSASANPSATSRRSTMSA